MSASGALRHGPPGDSSVHLCVDMQRMFAEDTEWKMPWLERVLPNIVSITALHPNRTIFSRFIPAQHSGQGVGMWRHYYERWASMTVDKLGADMIDVVPELARFALQPATSTSMCIPLARAAWSSSDLHQQQWSAGIRTIIITGGETDVCVLATMMGAIDWGFRAILVVDALCSSADETHDAMMNIYTNRFGQQVECVTTNMVLETWRVA